MLSLLSLFFLFLPFQWALSPVEGVDLAVARVLALGIAAIWLMVGLARRDITVPFHLVTLLFLSVLFFITLSLGVANEPAWGIRKLLFLFSFMPLYFVFADVLGRSPKAPRVVLSWLVIGSGITAAIAIVQFIAQFIFGLDPVLTLWRSVLLPFFLGGAFGQTVDQYPSLLVNVSGATLLRATAFFPDPHVAAYFFGLTLPCALALAQTIPAPRAKYFWFIASLILLADLLTFSRGGYLGLLASGVFWGLFSYLKTTRSISQLQFNTSPSLRPLVLLGMSILLSVALLASPAGTRLLSSFTLSEGSNEGRIAMWVAAGKAITTHPWLGVGIGNFPLFVRPDTDYRTPIYAHNFLLDVMAESGIVTGVFLLLLFIAAITALTRHAQTDRLFLGPALGLVILFTHSLFDTPLFSVHILPIFILFLAISSLPHRKKLLKQPV